MSPIIRDKIPQMEPKWNAKYLHVQLLNVKSVELRTSLTPIKNSSFGMEVP